MELIDTHSHIYLPDFDEDIAAVVFRAKEAGISKIVLPNIDSESISRLQNLTHSYPKMCVPLMGLHPTHVKENFEQELNVIFDEFEKNRYYGVGEIGIDLYWDKTFIKEQIEAFEKQIQFALGKNLPIVIHARESFNEILEILNKDVNKGVRGVFHAFTGGISEAEEILSLGLKIGLGGILTFKNSGLDATAAHIPLEHVVLETDSPYLTPTPFRGKRNESAYVLMVAEKLASIHGKSVEEVAAITSKNAKSLFLI